MPKAIAIVFALLTLASAAIATPEFVTHTATTQVYGEASGITMRQPAVPREDDAVDLWIEIGYSFFYTDVAVYYTTDGSTPTGTRGDPSGTTQVLRSAINQVTFIRNQTLPGGQADWWKATLPSQARLYGQSTRYKIGAWHSSGGPEV